MLKRVDIVGNPNIGVFILATDDIAIVPYNLIDEKAEIIEIYNQITEFLKK